MRRKKSYNRLPRPWLAFAGYLTLFGALFSPALLFGDEIASWLAGLIDPLARAFGLPSAPLTARQVALAAAASALALSAWLTRRDYARFHDGSWLGEHPSASGAYGSARLLTRPRDLKKRFWVWRKGEKPRPGVVVGGIGSRSDRLLVDTGRHHTLLLGGTGSGKTTSVLLPTQVCLLEAGVSTLTLDPKGEMGSVCGRRILESGARLVTIDFSDPRSSDGWLPLQAAIDCAEGTNGRHREELAGELRILAETLIPERRESSPMWTQAARILFGGIAGFVAESPMVPDGRRNLSTVAALAAMPQGTMQEIVEELPRESPARLQLASIAYAPAETYGGFATNLNAALSVYADPSVTPMLARSDFRPEDFLAGQVCLFVRFNSSTEAFNPLIAAFVEQTVDSLRRLAENRCSGTLPRPVYFLLEELPQLPRVSLGKTLAICRSQNIFVTCCVQSRAMLQAVYREDSAGMFDNMSTTLFLQASDLETQKHYSEALGSYTVETITRSNTSSAARGSSTKSYSYHESRLFRPEDLGQWGYDTGHLVIRDGQAFACSSLPISKTFVGDALGLDSREPDAAKRAEMAPERPVKNPGPAPVWSWGDAGPGNAAEGIAAAIAESVDPRLL